MEESTKKESADSELGYAEYRSLLEAAEREWALAAQLAVEAGQNDELSSMHIARAWYQLAVLSAGLRSQAVTGWEEVFPHLEALGLQFTGAMPEEEWREDLLRFIDICRRPPSAAGRNDAKPGTKQNRLRLHLEFLRLAIKTSAARLRKQFNVPLVPVTLAVSVGACLLSVLVVWAGYHFFRVRGPWREAFYSNIELAGEPYKIADMRDLSSKSNLTKNYGLRFDTCLKLDANQKVRFEIGSDDGSRLFIDGKQVFEMWHGHSYKVANYTAVLAPGVHHLRLDYFQGAADNKLTFRAWLVEEGETLLPLEMLRYPGRNLKDNVCGDL